MSSSFSPASASAFGNRHHRADAHDLRRHAADGEADEARLRLQAQLPALCVSDMTSAAAAPSLVCDELPAVTVPLA